MTDEDYITTEPGLMPDLLMPLDTAYGKYRPCVQLVDIEKKGGEYRFDFSKVRRWIGLCKKNGIRYYEICQVFTQWGMYYTPNIQATVDGEGKDTRFIHLNSGSSLKPARSCPSPSCSG